MSKRFLIWWLEAFGYVPKRRELIGVAVLLCAVSLFFWMVTQSLVAVAMIVIVLAVVTYVIVAMYSQPLDGIEEDFMQDNKEQERKRIEAMYDS